MRTYSTKESTYIYQKLVNTYYHPSSAKDAEKVLESVYPVLRILELEIFDSSTAKGYTRIFNVSHFDKKGNKRYLHFKTTGVYITYIEPTNANKSFIGFKTIMSILSPSPLEGLYDEI